jgi:hypothetical protein
MKAIMVVKVLSIDSCVRADTLGNLYIVRIELDGKPHALRIDIEQGESRIQTANFTDKHQYDLFESDRFYHAAIPRLLFDFLTGEPMAFPFRLVESGSGARYKRV